MGTEEHIVLIAPCAEVVFTDEWRVQRHTRNLQDAQL
jgi:hypothetical protein